MKKIKKIVNNSMEQNQNLVELYESNYIKPSVNERVVLEKKSRKSDDDEEGSKKTVKKRKKKKMSRKEIGAITYDSFDKGDNIFDQILQEMDEMGGESYASSDDNVFDSDDTAGMREEEETFTVSELRSMTLGELVDVLAGGDEDYEFDDGDDFSDIDEDDEIPAESVDGGVYAGSQGDYSGKAKRAEKSKFVKDNGDADFSQQDTGYDPEDTEGEEGYEHGAQGDYSGKAKRTEKSSFVKDNGDADFSKAKTGHRTRSGKKDKNYF